MLLIGIVVALPLMVSVATFLWSHVFDDDLPFPAGPQAHRMLVVVQLGIVLWVGTTWWSELSRYTLAVMYAILAAGAAYFRLAKGAVPCGCIGSHPEHRLSWWLVVGDLGLAVAALLSARERVALMPIQGISLVAMLTLSGLLMTTGLSDAKEAIRGYSRAADRFRPWLYDYKEYKA